MNDKLGHSLSTSEWVPEERVAVGSPLWHAIEVVPSAVAGLVIGFTWGPIPGVMAAGATAVTTYFWRRAQGRLALHAVAANPIGPEAEPRLRNLVEGLAASSGATVPSLWIIPEGGPNALLCASRGGAAIAVTRSLIDSFTRTELEAVLAHCVTRESSVGKLSLAVCLGPLGQRMMRVGFYEDAAAVALTRYPPALVAAINRAQPRRDRFGPFWFVGNDRSHEPQSTRAQRLSDL
jgi:Peptidase family M48